MKILLVIFSIVFLSACSSINKKPISEEVDLTSPPWHFKRINLKNAWNLTKGENSLVVLCDTGVSDKNHEMPNIIQRKNYLDVTSDGYLNDIMDDLHGTLTASIITGKHGIAPRASLISYRVSNESDGSSTAFLFEKCINYAIKKHADVVSISYDSMCYNKDTMPVIKRAIENKITVVAAAGNDMSEDRNAVPNDDVICVSSTSFDKRNKLSFISNWGKHVDITAPGELITSYNNIPFFGTSSAVPIVSGTIALMKSVNKNLNIYDITHIFALTSEDLGMPGKDIEFGYGMINVDKAVKLAKRMNDVAKETQ